MSNRSGIVKDDTFDRVLRVFSKSILSLAKRMDITVETPVMNNTPFAAWTDGTTIYVERKYIDEMARLIDKGSKPSEVAPLIARIKGFLYHEAGHCMFTPRLDSVLVQELRRRVLFKEFNLLEDQRIEMILTTRWSHKRFLTASTVDYVLKVGQRPEWQETAHLYVHGRKYLPANLRKVAYDNFKYGPETAKQVADIIDEFVGLSFPTDDDRAITLCEMLHNLIGSQDADTATGYGPGENHQPVSDGEALPENEQRQPSPTGGQQDDIDGDDYDDDDFDFDSETTDGADSGDAGDDVSDGADGDDSSDDTSDAGDSDADGGSGDNDDDDDIEDTGHSGDGSGGSFSDLLDDLRRDHKQSLTSNEALSDAQDFAEAFSDLFRTTPLTKQFVQYCDVDVKSTQIGLPARVSTHLRKLTDKFRRGWKSNRSSGHLNAVAYRTRSAGDTRFYDQFKRGQANAAAVEVVVLVDGSGSTGNLIDNAMMLEYATNPHGLTDNPNYAGKGRLIDAIALSAWAVKRAIDSLPHSRCSVLAFGSEHHGRRVNNGLLYGPNDRAHSSKYRLPGGHDGGQHWSSLGTTNPEKCLREGAKLFDGTRAANRLLVIVTDGQWDRESILPSHELIDAYNKAGVMTALFGVGTYNSSDTGHKADVVAENGDHHCQYAADLSNPLELPAKVEKLVADMIRSRMVTGASR